MDLSELNSSLENLDLADDEKKAILQLIDLKINNDMKEVIAELKRLESKMDLNQGKHSNELKIVYWIFGIAMAVTLFMAARMGLPTK